MRCFVGFVSALALALGVMGCSSDDSSYEVAPTDVTKVSEEARNGYTYLLYAARQPEFRDRESDGYVDQKVEVAIQDGVEIDAPVVMWFGQEAPLDIDSLNIPRYWNKAMVFVGVEHRGYGQSLSNDDDQSVPKYVSRREAIDDAHGVVVELKKVYTGPWFVLGSSYAGELVLEHAARFPEDFDGVISSSAQVDPVVMHTGHDVLARKWLGDESYAQVAAHTENLTPEQPFDDTWVDREFLETVVAGTTQRANLQYLIPVFKDLVAELDTDELIAELRLLDETVAGGEAARWAAHRALRTVSREEALRISPQDRVWFYQQCTELGSFQASVEQPGIFQRDVNDRREECRELFGVELTTEPVASRKHVIEMEKAGVPLVYVSGGQDPWMIPGGLEVPPEDARIDQQPRWSAYQTSYGRYFHAPDAFHIPESNDQELAQVTSEVLFELAGVEVGALE